MSIVATELKCFGSANMPEVDNGAAGGAIALTTKVEFTDISPAGKVEALFNAGAETMNLTITGRDAAGVIQTETHAMNGSNVVSFSTQTFERILKAVLASASSNTLTIRKASSGGDLITMEAGVTTVRRPFYNAAVPPSSTRDYYEKIFLKNTHGTLALTNAQAIEQADPSGKITFAMEDALDDNGTSTDRLTAPAGITGTFDSATKDIVSGGNLGAGVAQGVWLKLSLAAADNATKTTYTLRLQGNST